MSPLVSAFTTDPADNPTPLLKNTLISGSS